MDSSIYGAMIRLSQNWIMRYPLIDVHGNNGNVLGDGPAASRYTEARLSKMSEDGLLQGLKKKNVDFTLNYDESEEEPVTLPSIFPNLLCNPNEGIGWAMGCSWAPHNLGEVKDAIFSYLDGQEPMIPGPDFPTGGVVINKNDIPAIMKTGHGTVKVRGRYIVDGNNIIFNELPYGVHLEPLMDEIGQLCDEGKINGVADIRNETGKKTGLRLVIQIERGANALTVLNQLFAKSSLQSSFSYNQVALVGKTPTEFNLKSAIKVYVDHNIDCIIREAKFDLDKINARLHIVDGLLKALEDIDNIIALIKKSESASAAKTALIARYNFSEIQAKAILDMKLAKLASLEKVELQNEQADLRNEKSKLEALLNSESRQIEELRNRLSAFVKKYGDARRTELTQVTVKKEDKEIEEVPPQECVVVLYRNGNIKRVPASSFKAQKRNGKGTKNAGEAILATIGTNTVDSLMVFTDKGKMYRILVNDIPEGTNVAKGQAIGSIVKMAADENVNLIESINRGTSKEFIVFLTKNGTIKKSAVEEYKAVKHGKGVAAIELKTGDSLASVCLVNDEDILIVSHGGQAIRIESKNLRCQGRSTVGCKAIKLKTGDYVACGCPIKDTDTLAIFSENGYGKKVKGLEFNRQERGGLGVSASKSPIVNVFQLNEDCEILGMNETNTICFNSSEMSIVSRTAMGNIIMKSGLITAVRL